VTGQVLDVIALALYLLGLALTFGVRTAMHGRRTASSGFQGISGTPREPAWWGGGLFVVALVLGVAAPALAAADVLTTAVPASLRIAGLVLATVGLVAVLIAQSGMGASWRVGVDDADRTQLITGGVFALVRNPVFTSMVVAQAGLVLAVPTVVAVTSLLALVVAVQLQVRLLEEPYLLSTHGASYANYAACTGRFLPGVGRLRPACLTSVEQEAPA
jgi:protein-S-isoprenylcysteine O-methyltransferase Ste14